MLDNQAMREYARLDLFRYLVWLGCITSNESKFGIRYVEIRLQGSRATIEEVQNAITTAANLKMHTARSDIFRGKI